MSDYRLDEVVCELQHQYPNFEQVFHLQSRDIFMSRCRLRESLIRNDPFNWSLRWQQALTRQTYSVTRANSLWHIDSHDTVKVFGTLRYEWLLPSSSLSIDTTALQFYLEAT